MRRYRWWVWGGLSVITIGLVILGVAVAQTTVFLRELRSNPITASQSSERFPEVVATMASAATLNQVAAVEAWVEIWKLLSASQLMSGAVQSTQQLYDQTGELSIEPVAQVVTRVNSHCQALATQVHTSRLLKKLVPASQQQQLTNRCAQLAATDTLLTSLRTGRQTWAVMLQNSDELRPTGGFTGSYALLEFSEGILKTIVVEDIYDADGQFTGLIEAPPGIAALTTGGKGLRLPDANWWPHFPTSAQTQLQYLALGGKRSIAGVAAVNSALLEQLLLLTGPVPLPDYQTSLSASSAASLLRSHAEGFFPGSTAKKSLIAYAFAQLRQRLTQLPAAQWAGLLGIAAHARTAKDVQFYAVQPEQQTALRTLGLTGELWPVVSPEPTSNDGPASTALLAPVEANLGINKSNKGVDRQYVITITPETITVAQAVTNNPPLRSADFSQPQPSIPLSEQAYLNYQRFIVSDHLTLQSLSSSPSAQLADVVSNLGTPTTRLLANTDGRQLTESGLLTLVAPTSTTTTTAIYTYRPPLSKLHIWHQPGTGMTKYTLRRPGLPDASFNTDQDLLVPL